MPEDLKPALRLILLRHTGRSAAVKAESLAAHFGLKDDRAVRKAIEEMIDGGFPVCSVTEPPAGYFFPADIGEAQKYTVSLRRRALRIFQRRRHIVRSTARYYEKARQGVLV